MAKRMAGSTRTPKRRSPNLTPELIAEIVDMIKLWQGRLTWPSLIEAIEQAKQITYTRQGLAKHSKISIAFGNYTATPAEVATKPRRRGSSGDVEIVLEELEAEKRKTIQLQTEIDQLMAQFVRWSYNASQRGLTEAYLNQPLPDAKKKRELEMQRVK